MSRLSLTRFLCLASATLAVLALRSTVHAQPDSVIRYLGTTEAGGSIELLLSPDRQRIVTLIVTAIPCGGRTAGEFAPATITLDADAFAFQSASGSLRVQGSFLDTTEAEGVLTIRGEAWTPLFGADVVPALDACESPQLVWSAVASENALSTDDEQSAATGRSDDQGGATRQITGKVDLVSCYRLGSADLQADRAADRVRSGPPGVFRETLPDYGRLSVAREDGVLATIEVARSDPRDPQRLRVDSMIWWARTSFTQTTLSAIRRYACAWSYTQGYLDANAGR